MVKKLVMIVVMVFLSLAVVACGGGSGSADSAGASDSENATASDAEGAAAGGESQPAVTLKIANYLPSGNVCEKYIFDPMQEMVKDVNITLEYYPAETLLANDQILDGTLSGTCDIGFIANAYYRGRFPISFIFEYPIEFSSAKSASYTMKEALEQLQPPELNDFKLLFPFCSGQGCILTTKPIRALEDLKGFQIRANAIQAEAMAALGAVPATLTMGETYDAIRSGIVDGFVGLQEAGYGNKLYEVSNYFTYYPYANISQMIIMSKDSYAKLTEVQQKAIDDAAAKIFEEAGSQYLGWSGQLTINEYEAADHEIITISDEELAKFDEKLSPLLDSYIKTLDDQGIDGTGAKELILKLAAENNAKYPTDDPQPQS
jgi:TRAP-type C4-dicarboxylate transport system substrate-binding protein